MHLKRPPRPLSPPGGWWPYECCASDAEMSIFVYGRHRQEQRGQEPTSGGVSRRRGGRGAMVAGSQGSRAKFSFVHEQTKPAVFLTARGECRAQQHLVGEGDESRSTIEQRGSKVSLSSREGGESDDGGSERASNHGHDRVSWKIRHMDWRWDRSAVSHRPGPTTNRVADLAPCA